MSDNRPVATDALASLGTTNLGEAGRDAIHLAVEPVTSDEIVFPGQHIGILPNGKACYKAKTHIGIVDPFVTGPIYPGIKFWLIVYPRTITSLRHVWSHPSFPEEVKEVIVEKVVEKIVEIEPTKAALSYDETQAIEYLSEYISGDDWGKDYNETMEDRVRNFAKRCLDSEGDEYLTLYGDDYYGTIPSEFWDHVYALTGRRLTNVPTYFACSC